MYVLILLVSLVVTYSMASQPGLAPESGPAAILPDKNGFIGVMGTHSAKPLKAGAMRLGAISYAFQGLTLVDGGHSQRQGKAFPISGCFINSSYSFLSLGLGKGIDLGLSLPVYNEKILGLPDKAHSSGIGDAALFFKYGFSGLASLQSIAIFSELSAPTATYKGILPKQTGFIPKQNSFPDSSTRAFGYQDFSLQIGLGSTLDLTPITNGTQVLLHFNLSGIRPISIDSTYPHTLLRTSFAAEISPYRMLRLQSELNYERLLASPTQFLKAQATTFSLGLGLVLGKGFSLQSGTLFAPPALNPAEPLLLKTSQGLQSLAYRIYPTHSYFLSAAWHFFPIQRDSDRDGISDESDYCPGIAEDLDGFKDLDGCPEEDNDADGISDLLDRCPYAAEDFDDFEDADGCPDVDNDRDGILGATDLCPNDPEDKDEFQDNDGCPEFDNDGDGLADSEDKCPLQAENFNEVLDKDGCPDQDRDGDGIADENDLCPTEKEITNFYEDADGCPDQKPDPIREEVLEGLAFKPETADLLPGSEPVIKSLAQRLLAYPAMEIEIQAHVDDKAGDGAKVLTEARAEAVADALNVHGIELRRLKRKGMGFSQPRSPNRTAQGREMNRRIEIKPLN